MLKKGNRKPAAKDANFGCRIPLLSPKSSDRRGEASSEKF
jgi:hypothetical protein